MTMEFWIGIALGVGGAFLGCVGGYYFAKGRIRTALERAVTIPQSIKDKFGWK
jgi:hypothetical protein